MPLGASGAETRPRSIAGLSLARSAASRIDVHLAATLPAFSAFAEVYQELWDERRFNETIVDENFLTTEPVISRHMLRHLPTMLDDGIAERVNRCDLKNIVKWFGIPKEDTTFRLCEDLSVTKFGFTTPLPMGIEPFHEFIKMCLSERGAYLLQEDARSYFHQFELPAHARPYIGGLLGDERGNFQPVQLTVTSMGHNRSPAYAQRFSNGIAALTMQAIPGSGVKAWIDNFILREKDLQSALALRDAFRATCDRFNVILKPNPDPPSTTLTCLGITMDSISQSYKMSDAFIDVLRHRALQPDTPRQAYQIIGRLLWAAFVMRIPIAPYSSVIKYMSVLPSEETHIRWDAFHPLTGVELSELRLLARVVISNTPVKASSLSIDWHTVRAVWSDSSQQFGAWVIDELNGHLDFDNWQWGPNMIDFHIFYKELVALQRAIEAMNNIVTGVDILALTDNSAVAFAVSKGHSTNDFTNAVIDAIYTAVRNRRNTLFIHWVSTTVQRADALTRGAHLPGPPLDIRTMPPHLRREIINIPRQGVRAS